MADGSDGFMGRCEVVEARRRGKGHDRLCALVASTLRKDPYTGTVFVFRARRADRLKLLYWDGSGLVMAYKRLEDTTFTWPAIKDGIMALIRSERLRLSRPLVDEFFTWLAAQAARVSRKSELGEAMAYMIRREKGFRLFLDDGHVDIDSNLVENAIRGPAMKRRNALFAGHDAGGRHWARCQRYRDLQNEWR